MNKYRFVIKGHEEVDFLRDFEKDQLEYWVNRLVGSFLKKDRRTLYSMVYSKDEGLINELVNKIETEEDFWKHFSLQELVWQDVSKKI